jgi:hypothetical protein
VERIDRFNCKPGNTKSSSHSSPIQPSPRPDGHPSPKLGRGEGGEGKEGVGNLWYKYRLTSWYCLFLSSLLLFGQAGNAAFASSELAGNSTSTQKQTLFNSLPRKVSDAVRQDLSRRTGIPFDRLRVSSYSRQTWPGGCLGLERPGEVCTRDLVPGWRVVLSDGSRTWVYRTNSDGRVLRIENSTTDANLPDAVGEAVLEDASRRSGFRISQLQIVRAERRQWPDGCLGLGDPSGVCSQIAIFGWQVTVEGNGRRWVYRTDDSGSIVKFDRAASNPGEDPSGDLPASVADAVLADAARRSGRPTYQLRVVRAERRQWPDGCLGLGGADEACTLAIVSGWRVTVAEGESPAGTLRERRWVYRTNGSGSVVRFDRAASGIGEDLDVELPDAVAYAVLQDASRRSGLPTYRLRIVSSQRRDWPDGCLGVPSPRERCTSNIVPGWQVTVETEQRYLIYRANNSGSVVKFDRETSNVGTNEDLPRSVADAVLRDAARRSGLPSYRLRVVEAQRRTWPDGCLGLGGAADSCLAGRVEGWRVTVAADNRRWIYHTDESGSSIALNPSGSDTSDSGGVGSDRIPSNQLPPALRRNAIFRGIYSGGFAGRTYEINLLEDGRVVRRSLSNSGTSELFEREIDRVSRRQVQRFQELLEEQRFDRFDRQDYRAPRGSADYITVTLTGKSGTVRYADLGQNRLPDRLQTVIRAWNEIANSN